MEQRASDKKHDQRERDGESPVMEVAGQDYFVIT